MTSLVESAEQLILSLEKSESDLRSVSHRLEEEFGERFKRQTVRLSSSKPLPRQQAVKAVPVGYMTVKVVPCRQIPSLSCKDFRG